MQANPNKASMNKSEYFQKSFSQGLPNRCPILEFCQRRMWTIYFYNDYSNKNMIEALKNDNVLPASYEENEIKIIGENPEISRGNSYIRFANMCPEVNLFDKQNCFNSFIGSASTDAIWDSEIKSETKILEEKHFSECAEYSKYHFQNYTLKTNPRQKNSKNECYLYLMLNSKNGHHKIGISFQPTYRERTLQSEEPEISTVKTRKFSNRKIAKEMEVDLHNKFANKRVRGEWFDLNIIELEELYKYYEV